MNLSALLFGFWPLVAFNKIILSTVLFGVFWGWLQFFCFGLLWLGCLVLLLVWFYFLGFLYICLGFFFVWFDFIWLGGGVVSSFYPPNL